MNDGSMKGIIMNSIQDQINTINNMYQKGIIKNRLEKLKIHSFRKFVPNSEINFSYPLTLLVGKNGSGKTTIMKAIKLLSENQKPQYEFFETEIDSGGLKGAFIEYKVDGNSFSYQRVKANEWGVEGEECNKLNVTFIQTKSMVGAIEKSFFYDDTGKNTKQEQKVQYVIKQTRKLKQNTEKNSSKKVQYSLSQASVKNVNFILQKKLKSIEFIKHKYYSGTWASSVLFDDENTYSEYNAGSGEFLIACMVDKLMKLPEKSIVLLDEPEVSLHPGAQKRLIQFVLDIIKKKKIQVIIATHSTHIVEDMPKDAIKCFRKIEDDIITVEENVVYENAFLELETVIKNKKHIIVEDKMAKNIIHSILKKNKFEDLLEVEYYPGGAENIKKYIVFVYSKTSIANRYIIFDGDQYKIDVPDFSKVLEKDKTIKYYREVFKEATGINSSKMVWGIDANHKSGRYDEEQEKYLIQRYLMFWKDKVSFLPEKIPEDIIYDESRLKIILGEDDFPDVSKERDSKAKIKRISDATGKSVSSIEDDLVYWFIKNKNHNYVKILNTLKEIIED